MTYRSPVLHPTSGQEAGFDLAGLERVDAVMRGGLDAIFPTGVLLVARNSGVVFHRAYGYLDPKTRHRRASIDSLFDLASLTKLFTTTAFMTMVEAREVALDTPLADVLPEFNGVRPIGSTEDPLEKTIVPPDPQFAGHPVDAHQVTFWHLLTHTSGLAAWRSLYRENGEGDVVPLPHLISPEKRARRIAVIHDLYGFAYPPGQRVVYSDLGIILLGEAVTRLDGTSLEACIRARVLGPLGLSRTDYNPLSNAVPPEHIAPTELCSWRQRRCVGEVHDENAASLGGVAGHAGIFSTAWEVGALGQTYLNGGSYGDARLLSPQTVTEMTRVQVDFEDNPRGLGWLARSRDSSSSGRLFGPRSYGHTGFTGTSLWVDPDKGLLVVLLTNRVYRGRDPDGIADFRPRLHDAVVEALR